MTTVALALVILFSAQTPPAPSAQAPDVTGEWTGTWSSYNPAQPAVPPKEQCKTLTAKVAKKGDGYEATFEGDCGRPYRYAITMEGRAARQDGALQGHGGSRAEGRRRVRLDWPRDGEGVRGLLYERLLHGRVHADADEVTIGSWLWALGSSKTFDLDLEDLARA